MARPSTKGGFIPAEYEWISSILAAGFNGLEQIVYLEVCLQVYSMARLDHATLSPGDIAKRTGKQAPHVSRAIRSLVAKGVLVKVEDGAYKPVEDYERWDLGEQEGARAARIEYCREASRLVKSHQRSDQRPIEVHPPDPQLQLPFHDDPQGGDPPPSLTNPGHLRIYDHYQKWYDPITKSGNDHYQKWYDPITKSGNDSEAPIEERARGIESIKREKKIFLESDMEITEGPEKKVFSPSPKKAESPEEMVARYLAQRDAQRGASDG